MSTSLLYHGLGVRGYRYVRTEYVDGGIDIDPEEFQSSPDPPPPTSDFYFAIPQMPAKTALWKWSKLINRDIDFVIFGDFFDIPGSQDRELIGDTELEELARLPAMRRVRSLNLEGTSVTDAGLKCFTKLRRLQNIDLRNTQVTGSGLKHLKGLKNLEYLHLQSHQVTDAGLVDLKEMTNLKVLQLQGTVVTDAGVKDLQDALPNCKIER